jgi:hypothetical protein
VIDTTRSLSIAEILAAAREALALLAAFPLRWTAAIIIFLLAVESLMFIPHVGFLVKLYVAGVAGAQFLVMFAMAQSREAPRLRVLAWGFSRPLSAQLVLASCSLIPFFAGLLYLACEGGTDNLAYFFGSILSDKAPAQDVFFRFKLVINLAGMPLSFVAPAVVLAGLSGWAALSRGVVASLANWKILAVDFASSIAYEWSSAQVTAAMPDLAGIAIGILLLIAFVAWSVAFGYALSVRVYGPRSPATAP